MRHAELHVLDMQPASQFGSKHLGREPAQPSAGVFANPRAFDQESFPRHSPHGGASQLPR